MISPRVRAMVAEKPVEWEETRIDIYGKSFVIHSEMSEIAHGFWEVREDGKRDHVLRNPEAAALIAWAWMEKLMHDYALVQCRQLASDLFSVYVGRREYSAPSLLDALAEAVEASIGDTVEGGR